MEEQQRRGQQEQDEEEEEDEGHGDSRLERRQGGAPVRSKSGPEAWLEGRIAFAKALMDVGEFREVSRET